MNFSIEKTVIIILAVAIVFSFAFLYLVDISLSSNLSNAESFMMQHIQDIKESEFNH